MKKGTLFVISAPSGGGKGTLLKQVFDDPSKVYYSVSATTRPPRDEDTDGVTYYFMSRDEFEEKIKQDHFLEHAEYCGNYYGTPRSTIVEKLQNGVDVVLEIETVGAFNVKKALPEAVLIFILPPSMKELRRRLEKRGTEDKETVDKRMAQAEREIRLADKYDHIVINGELEKAVTDLNAVCEAARIKNNIENIIEKVIKNA